MVQKAIKIQLCLNLFKVFIYICGEKKIRMSRHSIWYDGAEIIRLFKSLKFVKQ